ncbi:alpha/beta hydrolase [Leifsonia shinshuensis]|uniref:alpha/beta fold hydrolase n=1 Tax=Leifsonia shinshuensis TaxID=150026 RepID=UPI001F50FD61|nr:alpha/beta fold hydrolase [Leifsonia shinshuensis]MCI0157801.1 alpha/beta hydrolase [Leifsonia shinshuensis]
MTQQTAGTASLVRTGAGLTSFRLDGAGPPLILVHGLQIGQELFDELRGHLVPRFTVITYDQRDRGATTFGPSTYTTDDLADDLAALIRALGFARTHVLGTSFGGMVAQAFALRHPELLHGLVLGATSQSPFRAERVAAPVAELLGALERGDEKRARALLARMAPAVAPADAEGAAGARSDEGDRLVRRFAAARSFDTRGRLGAIAAETLVLHGRDDTVVPLRDALSLAGELPRADVLVLAGSGHAWENEQPARAAAAIGAFLTAPAARR